MKKVILIILLLLCISQTKEKIFCRCGWLLIALIIVSGFSEGFTCNPPSPLPSEYTTDGDGNNIYEFDVCTDATGNILPDFTTQEECVLEEWNAQTMTCANAGGETINVSDQSDYLNCNHTENTWNDPQHGVPQSPENPIVCNSGYDGEPIITCGREGQTYDLNNCREQTCSSVTCGAGTVSKGRDRPGNTPEECCVPSCPSLHNDGYCKNSSDDEIVNVNQEACNGSYTWVTDPLSCPSGRLPDLTQESPCIDGVCTHDNAVDKCCVDSCATSQPDCPLSEGKKLVGNPENTPAYSPINNCCEDITCREWNQLGNSCGENEHLNREKVGNSPEVCCKKNCQSWSKNYSCHRGHVLKNNASSIYPTEFSKEAEDECCTMHCGNWFLLKNSCKDGEEVPVDNRNESPSPTNCCLGITCGEWHDTYANSCPEDKVRIPNDWMQGSTPDICCVDEDEIKEYCHEYEDPDKCNNNLINQCYWDESRTPAKCKKCDKNSTEEECNNCGSYWDSDNERCIKIEECSNKNSVSDCNEAPWCTYEEEDNDCVPLECNGLDRDNCRLIPECRINDNNECVDKSAFDIFIDNLIETTTNLV